MVIALEESSRSSDLYLDILDYIKREQPSKSDLHHYKMQAAKKHKVAKPPTDIAILMHAPPEDLQTVRPFLVTKPIRSLSGVSVIAVMSGPLGCPHGKCTYCPGGPGSVFGDTPMSYTGHEPSTMRGKRNDYHSYRIVFNRLEHYVLSGHTPDKCDVIIMGGTFPSYDVEYREPFVKGIYAALNDFSHLFYPGGELDIKAFKDFFELPAPVKDPARHERIKEKVLALWEQAESTSLVQLQKDNEQAVCRCIGLTQETKPDWALLDHCNEMLRAGTTRIEVGVQTVYEDVLQKINRGHGMKETYESFQIMKDLGFKINAHMMLGLPDVTLSMDERSLQEMFNDARLRPDMVKIYPTLVMKGTALYYHWKKGTYIPMEMQDCVRIIGEFFGYVPRYCRVMRVQRDIPSTVSDAGVQKTNLRQDVDAYMEQHNIVSEDIRGREIRDTSIEDYEVRVHEYESSGGTEFFISVDEIHKDKIIGFVRLRFPSKCLRSEITPQSALIRELHVYGSSVQIGKAAQDADVQHKGFGKILMKKAEEICSEHGKKKILVISGVGVRKYYEKIGYCLDGPYMSKEI